MCPYLATRIIYSCGAGAGSANRSVVDSGDPEYSVGAPTPLGGGNTDVRRRHLFGKNVCENERIGSRWGGGACQGRPLDPPMVKHQRMPLESEDQMGMEPNGPSR